MNTWIISNEYQSLLISATSNMADLSILLDAYGDYMLNRKTAEQIISEIANVVKEWRAQWNRTHRAPVSKQVKIKRNPFEMSGFSLFCQMSETQRSAEY